MQETNISIHKLLLLYIVEQAPGIRRSYLQDTALATWSMDYFDVIRALEELIDTGLLHVGARKGEEALDAHNRAIERCDLTDKGQAVIDALNHQIPAATRRFISQHLEEHSFRRKMADAVTVKIELTSDGQYELICRQKEGNDTSFLLTLRFPTEEMAEKASRTWRERPDDIVNTLIHSLLIDTPEEPEQPLEILEE
jgi:hypothetical protein